MFNPITTPRLTLRSLQPTDAAAMLAYRSDPQIARYQSWEPASMEDILSFISSQLNLEPDTPNTWFQVAITLRDTGEMIGDCGMHFLEEESHQAEIGFTLAGKHQGKGYATEAVQAVLGYLFDTLQKHRVYASADPRNFSSVHLLERIGMRQEAHFIESLWFKGEWADDVVYAMLKKEWGLTIQ